MHAYKFFQNTDCEFFPCHDAPRLNCLFCFCPLYRLDCGGDFTLTDKGIKDCSACNLPHGLGGYDLVVDFLKKTTG